MVPNINVKNMKPIILALVLDKIQVHLYNLNLTLNLIII